MKTIIYLMSFFVLTYSISIFVFGKRVKYKLPKNMKSIFTYHSSLSDKNYDNWLYAQRIFGNLCLKTSYFILPVNLFSSLLFFILIKNENILILMLFILLLIDIISLKITRFKTEKELRKY